jgi:hypothetical protein
MAEKYSFIVEECFQASNLDDVFIKRHNIKINNNQMLITGRACKDLKTGDILFSESIRPITILNFFAYRHEMDFMSAGMTCAIIIEPISENLAGQKLTVKYA